LVLDSLINKISKMIKPETNQTTFADVLGQRRETFLDKIDQMIDWKPIRRRLGKGYAPSHTGRPAYPPLTMFKILLLQRWYNMSDPLTEEMVADRLSFRRFAGLSPTDNVPDHSTINRFRDRIAFKIDKLFDTINMQLLAKGLLVRESTLIDASLVQSAANPPRGGNPSADDDASWGGKKDNLQFGYKVHVGMDEGSELIRKAELTPANEHDSTQFESMVSGDEDVVFADKGYFGRSRSESLKSMGIGDGIMDRAVRGRKLEAWALDRNRFISSIRCGVERFFGTMKRIYGFRRCRYYTFQRNRSAMLMVCMCYNLRRSLKLLGV